jgi:hypothetical protein
MHIASRLGDGPFAAAKPSSVAARPHSAVASSVSAAWSDASASAADEPPPRDRHPQAFGLVAAFLERALRHHGERGRELEEHGGPIDDERPPRRERAEPADVVDLTERGAARGVDEPPEERAQRALERRRQLARAVDEALQLAQPETRVVRGRAAPVAEVGVRSARVERVAAETDREHLEREVGVDVTGRVLPALLHEVEDLLGCAREEPPRLLEIGLLDVDAGGTRREERAPQPQRERATAAFERVHRGRALPYALPAQRDAPCLVERGQQRRGKARGACVGLLVVVLRGDANEVLEAELEIERIALGIVEDVGDGDDLDPAPRFVERLAARAAGHLPERPERGRDLVVVVTAPPERRETASETTRGDRPAVTGEDACGEAIPEIAACEEEIRSGGRDGCEHERVFLPRPDDGDELARGEEREPFGGKRRDGRERALAEHRRGADHPVEERAFHLIDGPGEPAQRSRSVDPYERLGMEEQRLEDLERAPDELGVGHGRHARDAHLETPRGEYAPAKRAVGGSADHRVERVAGAPEPASEMRQLERARTGLPDQDLEARAGLGVLGAREPSAVAEQRRAQERVAERSFDDAIVRDRCDTLAEGGLTSGHRQERRHVHVTTPRARAAPGEERLASGFAEERAEQREVLRGGRERRHRRCEGVGRARDVLGHDAVEALVDVGASAGAPARAHGIDERGAGGEEIGEGVERALDGFGEHRKRRA